MDRKHESTKFPQYRRYRNGHSYFKILSLTEFEEIKIVGKKHIRTHVVARQYPEKVFINDLLFNYEGFAEEITAAAFEHAKS
jgi:hypothetical protein